MSTQERNTQEQKINQRVSEAADLRRRLTRDLAALDEAVSRMRSTAGEVLPLLPPVERKPWWQVWK